MWQRWAGWSMCATAMTLSPSTPLRRACPTPKTAIRADRHGNLTWTGSAAAGFLPYVFQNAVLLPRRKDASKQVRVPKLSTLRSGREKSPSQVVCIHLQKILPTLRVLFGHKAPRSFQVEQSLRLRAYPAVFSCARCHAIKHDLEPGDAHSIQPVLMVHLTGTPWPSPILSQGSGSRPDHDQLRQAAWQSLPGRQVRLSQPPLPRTCPFREKP